MGVKVKHRGGFKNIERYLRKNRRKNLAPILEAYGRKGVEALSSLTPKDSGEAANAWYYEVRKTRKGYFLSWNNSKIVGDIPLVILLQYGHGTRGGAYVQGRDFINPALRSVVEQLSNELWKEVSK